MMIKMIMMIMKKIRRVNIKAIGSVVCIPHSLLKNR